MNYALLFKIANLSVLPGWFLLMILPNHRITQLVVQSYFYPVLLGLVYLTLIISSWGGDGGMDTLANLKISFSRDEILVLGWVHYLVFDLFIGAWMVRDSAANQIVHWSTIPSLILTLLVGPIGLLSYFVIRGIKLKRLTL